MNSDLMITIWCFSFKECLFRLQQAASEYIQFLDLGCVTITTLQKT